MWHRWHPDKHADGTAEEKAVAEAAFRRVNAANSVLSDPVKRRQYDAGAQVSELVGGASTRPAYSG